MTEQILILLTLMVSSKGIAAVPRASLVVITATLAMFDLPVEGVALIFAIDQFLDMGRTATNVVGNAVATSVITKWEGMLEEPEPADLERPHAPSHTPHHGTRGLDIRDSDDAGRTSQRPTTPDARASDRSTGGERGAGAMAEAAVIDRAHRDDSARPAATLADACRASSRA